MTSHTLTATLIHGDCLPELRKMPYKSLGLIITSPPYATKTQRYGSKKKLTWQEWVEWQVEVIHAACDACRGFVMFNANNPVKDGQMIPANEYLKVELHQAGVKIERELIWHKNSPPQPRPWWGNDWEPFMAFYTGERPNVFNWQAIGTPPKYSNGGDFRQRNARGERVAGSKYPKNPITRPRDVIRATVGGGHLGSKLAHSNAAPFPEKLVEPIILALTNPGDTCCDPFCGSSTVGAVALKHGRYYIGIDNDESMIALSRRRLAAVQKEMVT